MNPPQQVNSNHSNGQASSHAHPPRDAEEKSTLPTAAMGAPSDVPMQAGALSAALQHAQDNLLALQRMAEQTAALHRQFLEGQEKTQQIFLKLLEQERPALSLAVLDLGETPALAPERFASRQLPEVLPNSIALAPVSGRPLAVPSGNHQNGKAAGPAAVPVPGPRSPIDDSGPLETTAGETAAAILIDVVAEKTGYPAPVLDLDMQLDADLGIDSIKRVEILSAVQDRLPGLPALKPEQLGSFKSLRAIVDFISQGHPDIHNSATTAPVGVHSSTGDLSGDVAAVLLEIVADKTGYPADMLELDMRLDTDLGIDSIKRVEIFSAIHDRLPESPPAGPEQLGALGTLREIVAFLGSTAVACDHESRRPRRVEWDCGPVR